MFVIGIPFQVESVTHEPTKYNLPTVKLKRTDGIAGWLAISAPGADELKVGEFITINRHVPGGGDHAVNNDKPGTDHPVGNG